MNFKENWWRLLIPIVIIGGSVWVYSNFKIDNVPPIQERSVDAIKYDSTAYLAEKQRREDDREEYQELIDSYRSDLSKSDATIKYLRSTRNVDNKNVLDKDIIESIDNSREELITRGYK